MHSVHFIFRFELLLFSENSWDSVFVHRAPPGWLPHCLFLGRPRPLYSRTLTDWLAPRFLFAVLHSDWSEAVLNEAPQKTCRRKPQEATRQPGWLRRCRRCSDTPLIRQTEAAGSVPELCVGRWMRLMLFCCTWKEERMGEEEGRSAPGDCVGRRRGCAPLRLCSGATFT